MCNSAPPPAEMVTGGEVEVGGEREEEEGGEEDEVAAAVVVCRECASVGRSRSFILLKSKRGSCIGSEGSRIAQLDDRPIW